MSHCNACGELGVGDEGVSLSYRDARVKRLKFTKRKPHTCRKLLKPIHRITIECFEQANLSLLKRAFYECPVRKQLVWEMAIEKDPFRAEHSEEGYARRKLVYKEDVVFGCSGTKEELCQSEVKLPRMCKEDVEFATPSPGEGRDDVVYAEGTCQREKMRMRRGDGEDVWAGGYHLGFRRSSGSGHGVKCRCRWCDRVIVGPTLHRRPVFQHRLREWFGHSGCAVEAEKHTDSQVWVNECDAQF